MRRWKLLGIAGVVGLVATGAVLARRRRRHWREYPTDELRDRLRSRLADADGHREGSAPG